MLGENRPADVRVEQDEARSRAAPSASRKLGTARPMKPMKVAT
jgi:hypothetical protein